MWLLKKVEELNIFDEPYNHRGPNALRRGRVKTRIFIPLFLIGCIVPIILNTQPELKSVFVLNPSIQDVKSLFSQSPQQLVCPCANPSIAIRKIRDFSKPTFILDDWCSNYLSTTNTTTGEESWACAYPANYTKTPGLCETGAFNYFCELQFESGNTTDDCIVNQDSILNSGLYLIDQSCNLGLNWHLAFLSSLEAADILTSNLAGESQLARIASRLEMQFKTQISAVAPSSILIPLFGTFFQCPPSNSVNCPSLSSLMSDSGLYCFDNIALDGQTSCLFLVPAYVPLDLNQYLVNLTQGNSRTINIDFNYSLYFDQCAPASCTYVEMQRNSAWAIIVTVVALVGGLFTVLTKSLDILVDFFMPGDPETVPGVRPKKTHGEAEVEIQEMGNSFGMMTLPQFATTSGEELRAFQDIKAIGAEMQEIDVANSQADLDSMDRPLM
jgi:hypothetical protein